MNDLRDEARAGARSVISAAIAVGIGALTSWIKTRPVKRALERRRARRARPAKPNDIQSPPVRLPNDKHGDGSP
jgi:hypothetical protein